ncbi:MAG: cache domain-containing protein [Pseudomonadota bacterium]
MKKKNIGIQNFLTKSMVIIASVMFSLLLLVWVVNEYYAFSSATKSLKEEYEYAQKTMLKQEVNNVVNYIDYMKDQTERRLKSELKNRVNEALDIARNIYQENIDSKPLSEIEKMVKDALRPIRFLEGRGYYFAFSVDGIETLFADRPEMEGKNMLPVQGAKGEFVVKDMIDLVKKQGEGFYQYTWTKPSQKEIGFLKIAYVKYFKPFDWVFGTGEYLDDFTNQIQNIVLERIVNLRFSEGGYFFGSTEGGYPLFTNGEITKDTDPIWEMTDPNGVKIIQEQQNASKQPDGGFVRYSWPKMGSPTPVPKISFVREIPEWGWTIGAGVSLDTVEKLIPESRDTLKKELIKKSITSICVLIGFIVLIWFWAKRVANKTHETIETFEKSFREATTAFVAIPTDDMQFSELSRIAESANKMIEVLKKTEKSMQESEALLRGLFDNMGAGVAIYETPDEGQRFVFRELNRHGLASGQLKKEDVIGLEVRDVFPGVVALGLFEVFQNVWKTGLAQRHPSRIYQDGRITLWVENYVFKLPSGQLVAIYEDTTAKRQAEVARDAMEKQLLQAQKMESVGRLAGGVAHDFNNMLSVILGYTEMALEQSGPDHQLHSALQEIKNAAQRSADVTRQLLAFARKQTISPKLIDLNKTVKSMLKMLQRLIGENIALVWLPASDLWPVHMDPSQIDQILANLCVNARDAIAGTGKITLETGKVSFDAAYCVDHPGFVPGDFVLLTASDDGCGMDKQIMANLFEPFFTTKDVDKGTGLGLATVYGIVKQNNGFVNVYSEPGKGTTFKIYLPRYQPTGDEVQETAPLAPDVRGSETILLVEDESAILKMTTMMLQRLGYTVLAAATPGQASDLARKHSGQIHLLMTDVVMPEMNGLDLARRLQSVYPDLKCLFMSGYTANVIAHHGILDEGVHYIQKPFSKKDLSVKVQESLGKDRS